MDKLPTESPVESPTVPPAPAPSVCRGRPLRREDNTHMWFVTCRVSDERFMLHPIVSSGLCPPNRHARRACAHLSQHADKRLEKLIGHANRRKGRYQCPLTLDNAKRIARGLVGSALGRAMDKYKVRVFAVTVMSNHIHLVVQTQHKNLARFMAFFKARIADTINYLTGRTGPLWARRYDAQPILDDDAAAQCLAYAVNNPCKAGLVEQPNQWPGLNMAHGLQDERTDFEWFHRTRWHKQGRPKDITPFFETTTVHIEPIASLKGRILSEAHMLDFCQAQRRGTSPALGVNKVVHRNFNHRPQNPSRSKRPYAFGSTELCAEHRRSTDAMVAAYDAASHAFRTRDRTVRFPDGTYAPPIMHAA